MQLELFCTFDTLPELRPFYTENNDLLRYLVLCEIPEQQKLLRKLHCAKKSFYHLLPFLSWKI